MFDHYLFFFHIIALLTGVGIITIGYVLYRQYQLDFLLSAVFCAKFMSLIVLEQSLDLYSGINSVTLPFMFFIKALSNISIIGIIYFFPKFVHQFFDLKLWPMVRRVLLIFIFIGIGAGTVDLLGIDERAELVLIAIFIFSIILGIVIIIKNREKTSGSLALLIVRSYKAITVLFIPVFIADLYLKSNFGIDIYSIAIFYLVFNLISVYWLLKLLSLLPELLNIPDSEASKDINSFYEHYNLTNREVEVAEYLTEGLSYDSIATTLYVSKSTVKTHIRNIYRKLEISNKIELISMINSWISYKSP